MPYFLQNLASLLLQTFLVSTYHALFSVSRESSIQRSDAATVRATSIEQVKNTDSFYMSLQKAIKRKADSPPLLIKEEKRRTTTDISRPKRPFEIDFSQMPARYHGKFSKQMNFCQKLLKELLSSSRCKDFNWPFLEPVDDEALNIPDYYKLITNPMDLSTMQKKMTARQYASIDEFYTDVMLICENCFKFNPEGQPVNLAGKNLKVD
jgi:bromodomain-containing factor 1